MMKERNQKMAKAEMHEGKNWKIKMYDEMTWPEVEAAVRLGAHVMVPVGATEQHGEHLPLGTDNFQGIEIARRAAERLADEKIPLIPGPVIPFGLQPFLTETPRDYPGTISISSNTLKALLDEVCSELVRTGFGTIYLLQGHAENDAIIQTVAKEVTEKTKTNVLSINWLIGIRSRYKGILSSSRPQGHGGEGETARMLASAPHLVQMKKAKLYHPYTARGNEIEADILPYLGGGIGRYRPPEGMFRGLKGGITGDPQLATAETGKKVYDLITDWIVQIVKKQRVQFPPSLSKKIRPARI
jgi:creatinine amidohydrolase